MTFSSRHSISHSRGRDNEIIARIQISIQDYPTHCYVVFIDRNRCSAPKPRSENRTNRTIICPTYREAPFLGAELIVVSRSTRTLAASRVTARAPAINTSCCRNNVLPRSS